MSLIFTQGSPEPGPRPSPGRPFGHRRRLLADALAAGAGAVGLAGLGRAARAQTPVINDVALLQFTLNIDYLAAEYATLAVTGGTIENLGIATNGSGTPGPITVKASPQVPFADPNVEMLANELAVHERQHVVFLRKSLALFGAQPVARPALDLLNSFNKVAKAAGLPVPFDPFADDVNYLLGGYILEDVALTALHGAAPLLKNKDIISSAAGLLGIEGYHSAVIRTSLFQNGQGVATDMISSARVTLGGSTDYGVDDGPLGAGPKGSASIALTDTNALVPSRSYRQVLNILYGAVGASSGSFFPNGLNGPLRS